MFGYKVFEDLFPISVQCQWPSFIVQLWASTELSLSHASFNIMVTKNTMKGKFLFPLYGYGKRSQKRLSCVPKVTQ